MMERKATRFVHKLAERLRQSPDVALDCNRLKKNFKKVVDAMESGRLKKELLSHFTLYFKKLLHNLHAKSSRKDESSSPSDLDSTTQSELRNDEAPRTTQGFTFNLYAGGQGKLPEFPPAESKEGKKMLLRFCVSSNPATITQLNEHFQDKMSYSELKEVFKIMIGQKQPEIAFKYISMVVRHIGTELEPALASKNEERCADFHAFIGNLLTMVRSRMNEMSFPSNWRPSIESLLSALLSMLVDLSAVLSRSSEDSSQESKQIVTRVLVHLEHSPSHLLDVLLQLSSSSSQDAGFLAPLFRRVLCQFPHMTSNSDFLKYLCAIRQSKMILYSLIPTDVDALIQEACFKTPSNLVIWLQEWAGQWMRQVREKTKKCDTNDIVKFILEGAENDDIAELLTILTSSAESDAEDEVREEEEETDLFFVDKSQDDIQGVLPRELQMFEDQGEEVDSELEEEMNLADELLAELDRGFKASADKDTGIEQNDMDIDERDDKKSHSESPEPMDTSERHDGPRERSPELFVIQEEVSFEESRARSLGLHRQRKELATVDEDDSDEDEDGVDRSEDDRSLPKQRLVRSEVSNQRLPSPDKRRRVSDSLDANDAEDGSGVASKTERLERSKVMAKRSLSLKKLRTKEQRKGKKSLSEDDGSQKKTRRQFKERSKKLKKRATPLPARTQHTGGIERNTSSGSESELSGNEGAVRLDGKRISLGKQDVGKLQPRSKVKKKASLSTFQIEESGDSEDDDGNSDIEDEGVKRDAEAMVKPVAGRGTATVNEMFKRSHEVTPEKERGFEQPEIRQENVSQEKMSSPRSLRKSRRFSEKKKVTGVKGSVKENAETIFEVVCSSEIDERDSAGRVHERLSFPMLEHITKNTISPNNRRSVAKLGVERKSFISPKPPSDIVNTRKREVDTGVLQHKDEEKTGKGQPKAVEGGLEDSIQQSRKQRENALRRSTRIRLSSTSSVESRSDQRESHVRGVKNMTLRSRQSTKRIIL